MGNSLGFDDAGITILLTLNIVMRLQGLCGMTSKTGKTQVWSVDQSSEMMELDGKHVALFDQSVSPLWQYLVFLLVA